MMDENMEDVEVSNDSIQETLKRSMLTRNKLAIIVKGNDGVTQYCCVECPVRYLDKTELELHLCTHIKEYRYLCGICGKGLKRKEHLDRHTLEHQEVRPHICPDCGKGFKRKEHLNIHLTVHSGDKSQECAICGRSFSRKDHLQKHLQTHSKAFLEQNIHPLNDDELMDVKQEVDDEYNNPVIIGADNLDYDVDGGYEQDDETLNNTSQHMNEESLFACYLCRKTFSSDEHLKMHIDTHMKRESDDGDGSEQHIQQYDESGDDSQWQESYNEIEEDKHKPHEFGLLIARPSIGSRPLEYRPHECEICHKRFKRKQHLKVHMNVHFKHQPTIWCSLCNEGFYANQQFEQHNCSAGSDGNENGKATGNVPLEKKENKLPVPIVQISEPVEHQEEPQYVMMQDELSIPVPRRVYVCKYCSKPFRRKDHYKIHQHIHTGVKSFFCAVCEKGFYRKDHLQKHAQVHDKKLKPKKRLPDLYPIKMVPKTGLMSQQKPQVKPEITIHAPSNTKLRVPLQIKVPYQMVMSMGNGEQRAVTIDPQSSSRSQAVIT